MLDKESASNQKETPVFVKYELPREPDECVAFVRERMAHLGFPRSVLCDGKPIEIPPFVRIAEPLAILGFLVGLCPDRCIVLELEDPFRHISSVGAALLAA